MATQNLTLEQSEGWKKFSSADKVYAMTPQNAILEVAWASNPPPSGFIGYPISPGLGIARDFEIGDLYLRLPGSAHISQVTILLDEG